VYENHETSFPHVDPSICRTWIDQLLEQDQAYLCYCTDDRLPHDGPVEPERSDPTQRACQCRTLSQKRTQSYSAADFRPAVRFKTPLVGQMSYTDIARGVQTVEHAAIGDFTLSGSDGALGQAMQDAIDDHVLGISHVILDESRPWDAPREGLLCWALGWAAPAYICLPSIVRRDRDTPDARDELDQVDWYRERGYLPEALAQFLVSLGQPGSAELPTRKMPEWPGVSTLDLNRERPAVFDLDRLNRLNRERMKRHSLADLVELGREFLKAAYGRWERWTVDGGYATPTEWLSKLIESTYGELTCLSELPAAARFAFEDEVTMNLPAAAALDLERARQILAEFCGLLYPMDDTRPDEITSLFKELRAIGRARYELRGRDVMFQVRAALTGVAEGPCLEVVVCLLGRHRCLDRIARWRL
jgi:nondiscriminating glutamyl-tRNA synthetase